MIISSIAPGRREIVLGVRGPSDVIGTRPRSTERLGPPLRSRPATWRRRSRPDPPLTRALTDPGTAMELLRILAARLRDADRKRPEFPALGTLGRVAWRLQELGERFGEDTSVGIEVELPLSQEQLASWCGASREATVKALATLLTLGCIATGRRRVLIRHTDALRRHAAGGL